MQSDNLKDKIKITYISHYKANWAKATQVTLVITGGRVGGFNMDVYDIDTRQIVSSPGGRKGLDTRMNMKSGASSVPSDRGGQTH